VTDPADAHIYQAFARYGSGVCFVATYDPDSGDDRFLIAASVLTASVNPFHLAVSIGKDRDALAHILSGKQWSVHVLASGHEGLVTTLTGETTKSERLDAVLAAGASRSADGTLHLEDTLASFSCQTAGTIDIADQTLVVGRVDSATTGRDRLPLMRWNRRFGTIHHRRSGYSIADVFLRRFALAGLVGLVAGVAIAQALHS
jgi:flavin reductase (DIM6/NTAB) family NADH-FMN oxidoreductase RutF